MKDHKMNPDEARIASLYEKITGRPMTRGQWHIESRNLAQKIAYVESACRSVLATIEELEKASDPMEVKSALKALRTEFDSLYTLQP